MESRAKCCFLPTSFCLSHTVPFFRLPTSHESSFTIFGKSFYSEKASFAPMQSVVYNEPTVVTNFQTFELIVNHPLNYTRTLKLCGYTRAFVSLLIS